ncbi:uncharacterized protein LOC132066113 [Lycium ferocissimum]|uniref:uncharacterized protein LOC132066113 n=1 Tax=Lycium ferocissimum TaxID=112874 RepID=UPI0028154C90|nr:uncharacterized protein LOC132066113 [Lycium ferocissimum]
MLCKRLKLVLSTLVNNTQAAFVSGRSLVHNVLICHDLLRHYNRKTTPRCLMKIDLRKAYDMVKWDFLEEMMHGFGFPSRFVELIMLCVTTTKFSIKVSGTIYGYFEGKRGLRQGDPVSPLLFVLVMEYLSRVLNKMGNLPNFRYHPMCKGQKLTHLAFANTEKSNIFIAGVDEDMKERLLRQTGFTGAVFILPQSVVKEVDKLCRGFLWGNTEDKKKINLVAWEKICQPKSHGGLNIKRCKVWNIASVGKLIWWIMEKSDLLWVKWVHEIYIHNGEDFWTHIPPKDSSWYWRTLHKVKVRMTSWYSAGHYRLTATGKYSVVGAYQKLIGDGTKEDIAGLIWTKLAQPKHRFILWLAAQGRLLTKDRIHGMGLYCDTIECELCDGNWI